MSARVYSHRHAYKLRRRWHHPDGYLFACDRCRILGLVPEKFIRLEKFWGEPS